MDMNRPMVFGICKQSQSIFYLCVGYSKLVDLQAHSMSLLAALWGEKSVFEKKKYEKGFVESASGVNIVPSCVAELWLLLVLCSLDGVLH